MNRLAALIVGVLTMFGFQPRAFDQNVDRINRRTTIVYSADDIRRAITLCVNEQRPCVLELGDHIGVGGEFGDGFTLPVGMKSFRVDGADRFRFIVKEDIPFLFKALGGDVAGAGFPVEISNATVLLKPDVNVGTMFIVDQALTVLDVQRVAVAVRNVQINADEAGTVTNLFGLGTRLGALGRVDVDGVGAFRIGNVFAADAVTSSWAFARVQNLVVTGINLAPATFGAGPASAAFDHCQFSSVFGSLDVNTGVNSVEVLWSMIGGNNSGGFVTNSSPLRPQTLLRVSQFTPRTLGAGTVDLD